MEIPVEDKDELIRYKQILGRDTDLIHINEMTRTEINLKQIGDVPI